MEKIKSNNKIKKIVLFEMAFLVLGIVISFYEALKVLRYSMDGWGFLFFPLLGVVFLVILFIVKRNRFAWIPGIVFLYLFLIVGGFGFICCETKASVQRRLIYYDDKTVEAQVDDSLYKWNGNIWYNKDDGFRRLEELYGDRNAVVFIDGEESVYSLYCDGMNDVFFIRIIDGTSNVYLVLEKKL